ncbi:MAG TPA: hypothetical protein VNT80_06415 [Acidimicrobiales bacterium]|nr:hypothetical protein [Acidimicrobiales bacterium]
MKLSHTIPETPWRARSTWAVRPRMVIPLFGGLAAFGFGEGLLVQSQWGASPWTVFAQGIAKHVQISLGWSTALISVVVLLAWIPLRQRPGFGTIANVVIIAYVLDLTTYAVAPSHADWLKVVYVLGAVLSIGVGSAFYLTCNLGPGPRDGLMTGLHSRLNVSIVYIRLTIEALVLTIGWLLGGTVGIATAFFAATIGFSIGASLNVLERTLKWLRP